MCFPLQKEVRKNGSDEYEIFRSFTRTFFVFVWGKSIAVPFWQKERWKNEGERAEEGGNTKTHAHTNTGAAAAMTKRETEENTGK